MPPCSDTFAISASTSPKLSDTNFTIGSANRTVDGLTLWAPPAVEFSIIIPADNWITNKYPAACQLPGTPFGRQPKLAIPNQLATRGGFQVAIRAT